MAAPAVSPHLVVSLKPTCARAGRAWRCQADTLVLSQWRQFSFFGSTPFPSSSSSSTTPELVQHPSLISCVHSNPLLGDGVVLLADLEGSVHWVDEDWTAERSWRAYDGGRVQLMETCEWDPARGWAILVTVGVSPHYRRRVAVPTDLAAPLGRLLNSLSTPQSLASYPSPAFPFNRCICVRTANPAPHPPSPIRHLAERFPPFTRLFARRLSIALAHRRRTGRRLGRRLETRRRAR